MKDLGLKVQCQEPFYLFFLLLQFLFFFFAESTVVRARFKTVVKKIQDMCSVVKDQYIFFFINGPSLLS